MRPEGEHMGGGVGDLGKLEDILGSPGSRSGGSPSLGDRGRTPRRTRPSQSSVRAVSGGEELFGGLVGRGPDPLV